MGVCERENGEEEYAEGGERPKEVEVRVSVCTGKRKRGWGAEVREGGE